MKDKEFQLYASSYITREILATSKDSIDSFSDSDRLLFQGQLLKNALLPPNFFIDFNNPSWYLFVFPHSPIFYQLVYRESRPISATYDSSRRQIYYSHYLCRHPGDTEWSSLSDSTFLAGTHTCCRTLFHLRNIRALRMMDNYPYIYTAHPWAQTPYKQRSSYRKRWYTDQDL